MTIAEKLRGLREAMKKSNIQALIIPSNDAHQSEYVPDYWKSREWISGFTGSAGTIVVTLDKAGLWTDGRYYIQGRTELEGTEIVLHEMDGEPGPQHIRWLTGELKAGDKVAIDENICAIGTAGAAQKYLTPFGIDFVATKDLFSEIWNDRPTLPKTEIFVHDAKLAGRTRTERVAEVRGIMKAQNAVHHLLTTLDDIAWMLNLRGSDVEFNPVFVSYALVSMDTVHLFVDINKVPSDIQSELKEDGVTLSPYDEVVGVLNRLPEEELILIDNSNCTVRLFKAINCNVLKGATIPRNLKAIKNETEISYAKKVMEKDCRALAKSFYWLEQALKKGEKVTEYQLTEKLAEYRGEEANYVSESFNAIVGYKGNGAIIHYRPMPDTSATIENEGVLLCDSGGQYLDGTTDITRTFAMGTPSKEEKRNFTLVLKGMIALTEAKFPKGTTGAQLDTLARQFLWEEGLNFGHGTGHGVGFFMNVHEPPQGFAPPTSERGTTVHKVGMLSSNEPGYYKQDSYGIRLENLIVTVEDKIDGFLSFETITLYPIDIKMIDERLISSKEKAWLNNYHHEIFTKVGPMLEGELKDWFELKCRPMN